MFAAVSESWAPKWFLKVEDSVYVSPSHAVAATAQWSAMSAEYVGCLQHRRPVQWYDTTSKQDPDRDMISWHYHAHARKAAYAVSGDTVRLALLPNAPVLRPLQDEGAAPLLCVCVCVRLAVCCCWAGGQLLRGVMPGHWFSWLLCAGRCCALRYLTGNRCLCRNQYWAVDAGLQGEFLGRQQAVHTSLQQCCHCCFQQRL